MTPWEMLRAEGLGVCARAENVVKADTATVSVIQLGLCRTIFPNNCIGFPFVMLDFKRMRRMFHQASYQICWERTLREACGIPAVHFEETV